MSMVSKVQVFSYLLMFLTNQPCFNLINLTVKLTTGKAKSLGKKDVIDFSKYFL